MASNRVIVYGGRGALGSKCVQYFKSKGWWIVNIDMAANEEANENVIVKLSETFSEQAGQVTTDVAQLLGEHKVDAILCVAGGWAGGNSSSKDLYKNADLMWKQSVWTSTISSHIAALHLKAGGLLTLAGAKAALSGTGGMVGYGMAKAAVHQLCRSLAAKNSGMPSGAAAVAILPARNRGSVKTVLQLVHRGEPASFRKPDAAAYLWRRNPGCSRTVGDGVELRRRGEERRGEERRGEERRGEERRGEERRGEEDMGQESWRFRGSDEEGRRVEK
ncbi:hypothetical protein PAMA_017043 [Pampus argenteus]